MNKNTKLVLRLLIVITLFLGGYGYRGLQYKNYVNQELQIKEQQLEKLQNQVSQIQDELDLRKDDVAELTKALQAAKTIHNDNVELRKTVTKFVASRGGSLSSKFKPAEIKGMENYELVEYAGEFKLTFYTPSVEECGNDKGITASGKLLTPGYTVAVDRKYWAFGTKFYIEGFGVVEAQDTGSAIKGRNRFDVAMLDKDMARTLGGTQSRRVWVIRDKH